MKTRYYEIAQLTVKVVLPDSAEPEALLPSFLPFVCPPAEEPVLEFDSTASFVLPAKARKLLSEENDMGRTDMYYAEDGYYLNFCLEQDKHLMYFDKAHSYAKASIEWNDAEAGLILTSMLRVMFALVVILHDGISMHSSTVMLDGKGYMFMGKSGTGKSTHSRLWMQAFPEAELLNDDNPVVRMIDGNAIVFGTPWSGKTPCYRNMAVPVGGIVRLSQAPANRFERLEDIKAFVEIYKGCSVLRADVSLHDLLCDNLTAVVDSVIVGHLDCLPDLDAARLCHANLTVEK